MYAESSQQAHARYIGKAHCFAYFEVDATLASDMEQSDLLVS